MRIYDAVLDLVVEQWLNELDGDSGQRLEELSHEKEQHTQAGVSLERRRKIKWRPLWRVAYRGRREAMRSKQRKRSGIPFSSPSYLPPHF